MAKNITNPEIEKAREVYEKWKNTPVFKNGEMRFWVIQVRNDAAHNLAMLIDKEVFRRQEQALLTRKMHTIVSSCNDFDVKPKRYGFTTYYLNNKEKKICVNNIRGKCMVFEGEEAISYVYSYLRQKSHIDNIMLIPLPEVEE